jgi:hypothetical protein
MPDSRTTFTSGKLARGPQQDQDRERARLEVLVESQREQGDEDDALPGTEVAAEDRQ